jgi:NAD(P)-dependent dehydrogenase (short-subunit alcohol dehydrogenase family)
VSFDLELTGRRALVTAGTKGVGAAVVDVLHDAGATVVATARAIPADAHTGVQYIAADMTTAAGCATVAQGLLFRIVASLRNHHTTIRMADKNRRAVLSRGHTVTTSRGACRAARATASRSRLPVGVRALTAPGFAAAFQAT